MANYTPAVVKKKTKHGPNCKELNRCILYVQKAKHVALIAFLLYLSVSLCISLYLSVSLCISLSVSLFSPSHTRPRSFLYGPSKSNSKSLKLNKSKNIGSEAPLGYTLKSLLLNSLKNGWTSTFLGLALCSGS